MVKMHRRHYVSLRLIENIYISGRVITAAYVPVPNYHQLFPDAQRATQLLLPSGKAPLVPGGAQMPGMFV